MPAQSALRSQWKQAVLAKDVDRLRQVHAAGAELEWRLSNDFGVHGPMTALQLACLLDWSEGAAWLIARGACVDVFTRAFATPLSLAVKGGELSIAAAILRQSRHTIDIVSVWDESPLHITATADDPRMCQLLLDCGANPCQANSVGRTPLDEAVDAQATQVEGVLRARCAADEQAMLDHCTPVPTACTTKPRI